MAIPSMGESRIHSAYSFYLPYFLWSLYFAHFISKIEDDQIRIQKFIINFINIQILASLYIVHLFFIWYHLLKFKHLLEPFQFPSPGDGKIG